MANSIGERIKARRLELGLSPTGLGKIVGVTRQTIYAWERNDGRPSGENLVSLAQALKISPERIVDVAELPREHGLGQGVASRLVTVIGQVQDGGWLAVPLWPEARRYQVITDDAPEFRGKSPFGLEVVGVSPDPRLSPGAVVICTPIEQTLLVSGNTVVVRREMGGLVETTLRQYHVDTAGRAFLRSLSDPGAKAEPIEGSSWEIVALADRASIKL